MNLAKACRPSMQWYALLNVTTSKATFSLRKFFSSTKATSRITRPIGNAFLPGTMPWKVVEVGMRSLALSPMRWKVSK